MTNGCEAWCSDLVKHGESREINSSSAGSDYKHVSDRCLNELAGLEEEDGSPAAWILENLVQHLSESADSLVTVPTASNFNELFFNDGLFPSRSVGPDPDIISAIQRSSFTVGSSNVPLSPLSGTSVLCISMCAFHFKHNAAVSRNF